MSDTFLVSVGNAIGLDTTTREALFSAKANMSTAFKLSMQATDVRGGINNPLRFRFMHDRALEITLEQVTFAKQFLALNVGETITNGSVQVVMSECIELTAGAGSVTQTPVGDVSLIKSDGTITTVTPATKAVTLGSVTGMVDAIYDYMIAADRVSIATTKPPSVITLIVTAEVRDNLGNVTDYLQIEIPSFQISGNYTLTMTANGTSNESIDGAALSVAGSTCAAGDVYGYTTWIPATATTIPIVEIAVSPAVYKPAPATALTQQLSVTGIRGGLYTNTIIPVASCVFSKIAGGDADISVGSTTGIIAVANTSTTGDSATIKVLYGTLDDYVLVQVQ